MRHCVSPYEVTFRPQSFVLRVAKEKPEPHGHNGGERLAAFPSYLAVHIVAGDRLAIGEGIDGACSSQS